MNRHCRIRPSSIRALVAFVCRLTATLSLICLVVGLIAPTIHQSHRELVNIVSSSSGLAIMQTETSQVALTCRLRLGPNIRRDPLSGTPGGFNKWTSSFLKPARSPYISSSWKRI